MSGLTAILDDFKSDLNRVRDLLSLIKNFRTFGASTPPLEIVTETIAWKEAMVLKESAPNLRTDLPIMSGSMVLYLCGRLEYFVRQIVENIGDEIAAAVANYEALPKGMRDELRRRTLDIVKTPTKYGFQSTEADLALIALAKNLDNSVASGSGSISIASKILSVTESNMRPSVLQDVMKRVDFSDVWRELGKQAKLKEFLQESEDKECSSAAAKRLDRLMDLRNQIAHPTAGTTFPDPDQVIWITEYLEVLSIVLVDLCKLHLTRFTTAVRSTGIDPFA
ncbi:HEPN domain-containing protein [Sphaerisporangium sp. NPDC005288]|uniref:HEPN domain-containing protein n=1 Tax=Sphaerisporangium sp. NPDC005288 TaxID=3155114 RepID=UPI0033BB8A96